jgi:hypothetical protein
MQTPAAWWAGCRTTCVTRPASTGVTTKERERYDNAMKHLSEFDRDLSRNKFDKGKLDEAIEDVKNVVEHNTLEPGLRDALSQDLSDLRALRERRGAGY